MTTCDSAWIAVGAAGFFLLALTSGPIAYLAHRARVEPTSRLALWSALAISVLGIVVTARIAWGMGIAQLLSFAYLPAALGCAYATLRPDPARLRVAFLASMVSLVVLALVVGGFAIDALNSPPCPGPEIG